MKKTVTPKTNRLPSNENMKKNRDWLKGLIGLILFALVFVSLRTENGRCNILPFVFIEQCSSERIITKDEVSEESTTGSDQKKNDKY